MKYTCQLYVSGGYIQPLDEPMEKGTPYCRPYGTTDHINFLLPSPVTGEPWPQHHIEGYWK